MKRENQFAEFGFPEVRGPNRARRDHLEFMQTIRLEEVATNREFMGPMCCIPAQDWKILKIRFPELIAPDPQIQKQAWDVFMAHAASLPYRTKERARRSGLSN